MFDFIKQVPSQELSDTIFLSPGSIIEDVVLDCRRMPAGKSAIEFVGRHDFVNATAIRNVIIRGNESMLAGVRMRSMPGNQITYCHVDVSVTNCKTGLLMDSREGSYVTANQINFTGFGSCLLYTSPSPRDRG